MFLIGVSKLTTLVRSDSLDEVSKLLMRNPKLAHVRDRNGNTALIIAALLNRQECGLVLVLRGADINASDTRLGYTALHIAVEKSHVSFATMLLERGADPNAINSKLYSPLHLTALNGCKEVVHLLVEKGARLDPPDNLNRTPVQVAIEMGNTDIACMLIERGCDLNVKDKEKKTPLQQALGKGYLGIVSIIEFRLNQESEQRKLATAQRVLKIRDSLLSVSSSNVSSPASTTTVEGWRSVMPGASLASNMTEKTPNSMLGAEPVSADSVLEGVKDGGSMSSINSRRKKSGRNEVGTDATRVPDQEIEIKSDDVGSAESTVEGAPSTEAKKLKNKKKTGQSTPDGDGIKKSTAKKKKKKKKNRLGEPGQAEIQRTQSELSHLGLSRIGGDDDKSSVSELSVSTLSMSTRMSTGRKVPSRVTSSRPPVRLEETLAYTAMAATNSRPDLQVERVSEDPNVRRHKLRSLAYRDSPFALGEGGGSRDTSADFAYYDSDGGDKDSGSRHLVLCGLVRAPTFISNRKERSRQGGNEDLYVSFAEHMMYSPDAVDSHEQQLRSPSPNRSRVDLSSQEAAMMTARLLREQRGPNGLGGSSGGWCAPLPFRHNSLPAGPKKNVCSVQ